MRKLWFFFFKRSARAYDEEAGGKAVYSSRETWNSQSVESHCKWKGILCVAATTVLLFAATNALPINTSLYRMTAAANTSRKLASSREPYPHDQRVRYKLQHSMAFVHHFLPIELNWKKIADFPPLFCPLPGIRSSLMLGRQEHEHMYFDIVSKTLTDQTVIYTWKKCELKTKYDLATRMHTLE